MSGQNLCYDTHIEDSMKTLKTLKPTVTGVPSVILKMGWRRAGEKDSLSIFPSNLNSSRERVDIQQPHSVLCVPWL
jgi:hypothetical protein